MNQIEFFHEGNKLQKALHSGIRSFKQFFKPNPGDYQFETYTPKIKKGKLVVGIGGTGVCLATPATNWAIIPLWRWVVR